MNTTITLSLDKRRRRKDNSYPIILRLGHYQRTTSIATGISVPEAYWDDTKKKIKNSYKNSIPVVDLNTSLQNQISDALNIINEVSKKNDIEFISVSDLKAKIANKKVHNSFLNFGFKKVEELRKEQRLGSARSYEGLLNILKTFKLNKDICFEEVNYNFLKKFESFHLSKPGNSLNGLASYLRTLKAIYNKGLKEGVFETENHPFDKYKIKTNPTGKRAINVENVKKILTLKLNSESSLFHYRNYFVLSYMLLGMSFIDMAFLKLENIKDGRIKFQRKKTSKPYDIKITEQLKPILRFYTKNKNKSSFILPILKRDTLELQYKDAQWALKRYNKGLKKIAELCGIEENLTSYVSRHSFATHALLQNVPLAAISAMLGHSKLSTTQVYLKSLPNNILDQYQEQLNKL